MAYSLYHRIVLVVSLLLLVAAIPAASQQQCLKTWTLDEDFDDGTMINVDSGDGDELRLSDFAAPLPYLYVAASMRGTVIRIDINTGAILGEYVSAPEGMGRNPSRTTVDRYGNVWVANRDEAGMSGGESKGSITRIGVVIGGTRGIKNPDGTFTPNADGEYLQPPFTYSTVADRDHDGLIHTSKGLGNILAWTNAGDADRHGGVTTAEDEAIINYVRVAGANARTIAVDASNDVWCGGTGDRDHEKVDGITGLPVPGTKFNTNCGGYGGLIDRHNVLWSAQGGIGLLRYDTETPIPPAAGSDYMCLPPEYGDYGLGLDPQTGNIWHTTYGGNSVKVLAPDGTLLASYYHGNNNAQGVAVDGIGNVWVAHSNVGPSTTVGHLRTDGTYIGNISLGTGLIGPTGVAIDANGKVWVTCLYSDKAMRIDPAAGPLGPGGVHVGEVDLSVDLGAGAWPYNYSDMTGYVLLAGSYPSGSWNVVHDGGTAGTSWRSLSWTSVEPSGSSIIVEIRASNNQAGLAALPFIQVGNAVDLCDREIVGRYAEVRVRLFESPDFNSPVLKDITLACCGDVPPPEALCHDTTLVAGANCLADAVPADIDAGSYDPSGATVSLELVPPGPFGIGDHQVLLVVSAISGVKDTCQATITVIDTTAPVITLAGPLPSWPPNHKYNTVTADDMIISVIDDCDTTIGLDDVVILRVTSDELEDARGNGDGNTLDDINIASNCNSVDLRSERSGGDDGRVYRIYFSVTDASGNTALASYRVDVPHNNDGAHEDNPAYTVTGGCDGTPKRAFPTNVATGYSLEQNIPNPFSSVTLIPFTLGAAGRVTITAYDERGTRVAVILDEDRPAGAQETTFDAAYLASGAYTVVMQVNGVTVVREMVLAK